jgi:hypothetical protein
MCCESLGIQSGRNHLLEVRTVGMVVHKLPTVAPQPVTYVLGCMGAIDFELFRALKHLAGTWFATDTNVKQSPLARYWTPVSSTSLCQPCSTMTEMPKRPRWLCGGLTCVAIKCVASEYLPNFLNFLYIRSALYGCRLWGDRNVMRTLMQRWHVMMLLLTKFYTKCGSFVTVGHTKNFKTIWIE